MTPVQATCIPLFLEYKDVAAQAVSMQLHTQRRCTHENRTCLCVRARVHAGRRSRAQVLVQNNTEWLTAFCCPSALQVTGSGKTLAFLVPAVEMLLRDPPKCV